MRPLKPSPQALVPVQSPAFGLERAKHLGLELQPPPPEITAETMPETFGVFVDRYYFPHAESTLRPSTVRLYRERWRTRLEPAFGALAWPQITPMRVLQWITALSRDRGRTPPHRPLAPRTVKQAHDTLSGMLQLAFLCGLLSTNPARQVREAVPASKPAAFKRGQPKRLRAADVIKLLTCGSVPFYRRAEIAFSIYTACRPGEVRAARWGWLLERESIAFVLVQETDDHGTTKTGETREVPVHPELADVLDCWRDVWTTMFDRVPTAQDFLFPNTRTAQRRSPDHTHFRNLLRRAGVPEITPHGLRHTGAQLLRDIGCPQSDIGAILGHADSSTTAIYADAALPVLADWIGRVFLLGAGAGRKMLASRRSGPVCDQTMQVLTHQRGALSGQCSPGSFRPFNKISANGHRNPTAPCSRAPLVARATAKPPSDLRTRAEATTLGAFDGAVFVALFAGALDLPELVTGEASPAPENAAPDARRASRAPEVRFPVRGAEEAARLCRAIYLRDPGSRLEVLDDTGAVIATREGPDPRPRRTIVRKDGT